MSTTAAAYDGTPAGLLFKSYEPDAYLYYMWKLTVSFATALCVGVVGHTLRVKVCCTCARPTTR